MKSINPYTLKTIATYPEDSEAIVNQKIDEAHRVYSKNRLQPLSNRIPLMQRAASILKENKKEHALMISKEMGKPISEAYAEVEKCAWVCDYYADNVKQFLADKTIETDADKSFVKHQPIGVILAVMPWNFPFWQVFRFAAPALLAGNTAVLKHASNVQGSAQLIQQVFEEAGFEPGSFINLAISSKKVEHVLRNNKVKAATVTGSDKAGQAVAKVCGEEIKKTVLELGGSNAFIVLEDADIDLAAQLAVKARMINNAQSCIAAKRFIVHENVVDEFASKFVEHLKVLKSGDPLNEDTQVGPMARVDLAEELEKQLTRSLEKGAKLLYGGSRSNAYFEPTVITDVKPGMPAFDEELFGPVAAIISCASADEAVDLANKSEFGLGASIITDNTELALELADRIEDGAVFINELVKSDPRLPFGGTKKSGYGRELSSLGIQEFLNHKTIYVNKTVKV